MHRCVRGCEEGILVQEVYRRDQSDAIPLYCDNNGIISLAKKSRSHKKFKHIERRYHLICDYLKKNYVKVKRVDSTDNVADPLTKSLGQQKIEAHLEKMGIRFVANWL